MESDGRQVERPVAVLELTDSQRAIIKQATGRDLPKLELTRLEMELASKAAGYDAPGDASG